MIVPPFRLSAEMIMDSAHSADATKIINVATFSPGRVFRWGLYMVIRSCVGWWFLAVSVTLLYFYMAEGPSTVPTNLKRLSLSDTQAAIAFGLTFVLALLTAFTYIRSSFRKSCYFRAGPKGISINLPRYRFLTYRLEPQQFSWSEIGKITQWRFIFNGITVYNLLYIDGLKKQRVFVHRLRTLPQFLFREPIPSIIERLEEIREKSPYKPEPII